MVAVTASCYQQEQKPLKVGRAKQRAMVCHQHLLKPGVDGGRLDVDAPVHLLSLRFVLKQLKWIPGGLCFLIGRTDITEV